MRALFPRNESDHSMTKRNTNVYQDVRCYTERFRKSAIPSMVRLLNEHEAEKQRQFRKLVDTMPVTMSVTVYITDNNNDK